jgi:hypothetical protein
VIAGRDSRHGRRLEYGPGVQDRRIEDVLAELGLVGDAAARARAILHEEALTNPRKERISVDKVERVRTAIDRHFARLCQACATRTDAAGREVVTVAPAACPRCGGSDNARALAELAERARAAGLRRLVVVGGSPNFREAFAEVSDSLELRLVDGTTRRTKADARRDVDWADVVVVLGATELAHKVSSLYTDDPRGKGKTVVTARRGVSAIAEEVARHAERRARH